MEAEPTCDRVLGVFFSARYLLSCFPELKASSCRFFQSGELDFGFYCAEYANVVIKNVKCLRGWGIIGNFAGEYGRNGIGDFFRKY